jgi:hypothetical protein
MAKDDIEAYAIFNLAAVTESRTRGTRELLEKALSRDEISAGQRRSWEIQKDAKTKLRPRQEAAAKSP